MSPINKLLTRYFSMVKAPKPKANNPPPLPPQTGEVQVPQRLGFYKPILNDRAGFWY